MIVVIIAVYIIVAFSSVIASLFVWKEIVNSFQVNELFGNWIYNHALVPSSYYHQAYERMIMFLSDIFCIHT